MDAGKSSQISLELLRDHIRQHHTIVLGNFSVAIICTLALWQVSPHQPLLIWLFMVLGLNTLRWFNAHLARSRLTDERLKACQWRFFLPTLASGIAWGMLPVIMSHHLTHPVLIFMTMILIGMVAGSMASLMSFFPAFVAFVISALSPLTWLMLQQDNYLFFFVGAIIPIYMVVMLGFGWNSRKSLLQSLSLRFENRDLIHRLQQHAEEALHAKEAAEVANQAKSRFLASASHDLRQPLQALNLFIEALSLTRDPGQQQDIVGKIKQSTESLANLLNSILDISKLDAGGIQIQQQDFPLQLLLDMICGDFHDVAKQQGLRLRVMPSRLWAHSDPALVERILRNLVSNAVKYTPRGKIVVGARKRGDSVRLMVADSGDGIPHDQHDSIFEEFVQLQNPERDRSKGLGLGLAIVARTARLIGARVQLQSTLGRGTCFYVDLPLTQSRERPVCINPVVNPALRGLHVMVIDDEPQVLESTILLLDSWGCLPMEASSGEEALEGIQRSGQVPDVIISDYRLRDSMNGADAIALIHSHIDENIPAILMTGDTSPNRLQETQQSGYILLHKPVQPDNLAQALASVASYQH